MENTINPNLQNQKEIDDLITEIKNRIAPKGSGDIFIKHHGDLFLYELDNLITTLSSFMSDYPRGTNSSFDITTEQNRILFELSYLNKKIAIEFLITLTGRNIRKLTIKGLNADIKKRHYFLKVRHDANQYEEYVWRDPVDDDDTFSSGELAKIVLIEWLTAVMPEA